MHRVSGCDLLIACNIQNKFDGVWTNGLGVGYRFNLNKTAVVVIPFHNGNFSQGRNEYNTRSHLPAFAIHNCNTYEHNLSCMDFTPNMGKM